MESDTPWSATVSNQRMNTLASLHLRNIDIMVHVGGGQESPRKSEYKVNVKHVGGEQTISFGWHRKLILFPIPGQKNYTSGITNSRNILIFKSFWILHTVPKWTKPLQRIFFSSRETITPLVAYIAHARDDYWKTFQVLSFDVLVFFAYSYYFYG